MKAIYTAGLLACSLALAGCAVPQAAPGAADARDAEMAKAFQDEGELLTGSRIPHKSSSHSIKQVGGKDYKNSTNGQHNPAEHK
jgi:hypothetical protein